MIGAATFGLGLSAASSAGADRTVRLGVIGTGGRGTGLLKIALAVQGLQVEVPALCDTNKENLAKAQDAVQSSGRAKPEGYSRGAEDYKRLIDRDDIDAVLIATPWQLHTPMAVYAMKAGKYVGVEVPMAVTLDQCWELINTQEKTGTPCMMMENWSFRRDNLALLNIIRKGLLGEINYAHGAYAHDCIEINWLFDAQGGVRWQGDWFLKRNADQYPTHGLGPIISWMDINCGDYPAYLTSTATRAIAARTYYTKKFGPDHPASKRRYKQGDVVTTVVKTIKGKMIVIKNDMQSPRPYDNEWMASGTNGMYNEMHEAIYIAGTSPHDKWEPYAPYQNKYDHALYRALRREAANPKIGHGGPDYLEVKLFLEAARDKKPTPIDIYDSVIMSAPVPLSAQSIANGSAPVPFPDFTRGKWKTNKPYFALDL